MKNPGWIDLQVNGHAGVDYSEATLSEESFLRSAEALINDGTEIFCPTIVTGTLERFTRNAAVIRQAVEKHGLQKHIPGLHFEGPFISNTPGAVGAHDPALTLIPTAENVEKLLAAAPGFVTIVTLGADVENAAEATAILSAKGVIVSTGHHVANYAQIRDIAANGGQLLTHLGNGCPNLVGRHENPIYAGMAEDRLTAMIITDGHHLPGELIKLICRAIEEAEYSVGEVGLALDVAASEWKESGAYHLPKRNIRMTDRELIDYLADLADRYPIVSIEDGVGEEDYDAWRALTEKLGHKIRLVGANGKA